MPETELDMIAVTGATGKLGHHVMDGLLKNATSSSLRALVRDTAKAARLAAANVDVRRADYDNPSSLAPALEGVDTVLLISANQVGRRLPQHLAVLEAAVKAGVRRIVYTSLLRASTSTLALAGEHKATEEAIRNSGLAFVILRNGWYTENHTGQMPVILQHGAIVGAAGNGRFASATRADYAAAAVAVLTSSGHDGKTYELAGDHAFTLTDLAEEISRQTGRSISYTNLPADAYRGVLTGAGVPAEFADILVDSDLKAAAGELDDNTGELRTLIGRPTTPLADAVSTALAAAGRGKEG
jgi:NAD(P)H dehydrogenase (quinone)